MYVITGPLQRFRRQMPSRQAVAPQTDGFQRTAGGDSTPVCSGALVTPPERGASGGSSGWSTGRLSASATNQLSSKDCGKSRGRHLS